MIKQIVLLIEEISNERSHPDKIARMYDVFMSIGEELIKRFVEIRKEKQNE